MSLDNNETFEIEENALTEPLDSKHDEDVITENNIQDEPGGHTSEESQSNNENETEEQGSKSQSSKNIIYVICVLVIIVCLAVLGRNIIAKGKNLFQKFNNKDSDSTTVESASINAPDKIKDLYILADLPDDYKLKNQDISDTKAVSTYKNKEGEIALTQSTISDYTPEYDVSDENIVISDFYSGAGQDYKAYQIDNKCYIVWTTDEYTFEIKTSMKKSESIPLILNVQKAVEAESAAKTE